MNSSQSEAIWFCSMDGTDHGPVTSDQLKQLVQEGKLKESHPVWKAGAKSRIAAGKVKGLFAAGQAAPVARFYDPSIDGAQATEEKPDPATRDVFISYSSHDKLTADAICGTLEHDRVRCWIAPRDVLPGVSYGEAIIDGINISKVMVVVLSSASNGSPQVLREVERAVSKGIPIIPFRIEDVTPSKSMEYFLSAPHWLDALTKPVEAHIQRLSQVVKAVLNPSKEKASTARQGTSAIQQTYRSDPADASKQGASVLTLPFRKFAQLSRRNQLIVGSIIALFLFYMFFIRGGSTVSLQAEYEKYKQGLLTGRGSIMFLKDAAPERFAIWMDRAKAGDPIGELFVARCYQEGLVMKKDESAALPWLTKSAAQGNDYAMHTLGLVYDAGMGVETNRSESLRWYKQAADKGNTASMRAIGKLYENGINRNNPEPEVGLTWYHKAADKGDPVAMRMIGDCYLYGKGITTDSAEADRWYEKAAKAGNPFVAGALMAKRMAPMVTNFLSGSAGEAQSATLTSLKKIQDEFMSLDLAGVSSFFNSSDWTLNVDKVQKLNADDPLRVMHQEMLKHYIKRYSKSSLSERILGFDDLSKATEDYLNKWYQQAKYDEISEFWEKCYRDIPVASFEVNRETNSLIREFNFAINSLIRTGKRKEARELLQTSLELCDWILKERPWDWYTKDAYSGLCFDAAQALVEVGEKEEAQQLLKRAWQVRLRQFGKEALLEKYKTLPLKGESPDSASANDKTFFESFSSDPAKSKGSLQRYTIQCIFNNVKFPFYVYVLSGPRGYAELQDQFRWVKEMRGGEVPAEVRASFLKLNEIAVKNNVSFIDLCDYALTEAGTEKK
jgi:TPR repeat protein